MAAIQDLYKKVDDRVSFHVLCEEEYAERFHGIFRDHVFIHGVPSSYKPRKAKYKARALEWFRIDRKIQDDDWVLYLDEETMIDEYTVKTCVEFISKQDSVDLGTVSACALIRDSNCAHHVRLTRGLYTITAIIIGARLFRRLATLIV